MFLFPSISLLALAASNATASKSTTRYRKVEEYSGSSFFDGFTTYTGYDPTNGYVDYLSMESAAVNNLTAFVFREEIMASNAYIGVDYKQLNTNTTSGRKSVRLTSKSTFDVGLLAVIDVLHAPTGPGVWPAVWLLGNVTGVEWPNSGEMDIMEWVNDLTYNAMTLHTAPGCSVDRTPAQYQGQLNATNCNDSEGHLGCSIHASPTIPYNGSRLATAGPAFNAQGGGVYVLEWTLTGVSVWLFPRSQIPPDLASEKPNPSTWTTKPLAKFTGSQCNFDSAFQQQQLIINICLCGDWAGAPAVWAQVANKTGSAGCEEYVATHPESFKDAYFEFASITMYSSNPAPPGIAGQSKAKRGSSGYMNVDHNEALSEAHAASSEYQHGHLAHAHIPRHAFAPYSMTNTTNARAGTTAKNGTAPRPPLISPSGQAASDGLRMEVAGYLLGAVVFFIVAAII